MPTTQDNGFIDLGCGLDSPSSPMMASPGPKKTYPCFSFSCDEEIDLPDGDFTFMAKGRKVLDTEETRDPEDPRYRYEIEVQGFKPMGGATKDSPDLSAKLKDGMRKSMGKMMDTEDAADESDPNEEYD